MHEHTQMSLVGNCGKSGQTNLFFAWCCLLVWFCVWGSVLVSPLAAIIAARRCGMIATRHCGHSTGISTPLSSRSLRSSPRFWGGLPILVIALFKSFQICFMGLQSGYLAGCSILVTLPCWRKSRTTRARWGVALVLVAEVIPEMLPGKWH